MQQKLHTKKNILNTVPLRVPGPRKHYCRPVHGWLRNCAVEWPKCPLVQESEKGKLNDHQNHSETKNTCQVQLTNGFCVYRHLYVNFVHKLENARE